MGQLIDGLDFDFLGLHFEVVIRLAQIEEKVVELVGEITLNLLLFALDELVDDLPYLGSDLIDQIAYPLLGNRLVIVVSLLLELPLKLIQVLVIVYYLCRLFIQLFLSPSNDFSANLFAAIVGNLSLLVGQI